MRHRRQPDRYGAACRYAGRRWHTIEVAAETKQPDLVRWNPLPRGCHVGDSKGMCCEVRQRSAAIAVIAYT